VKFDSCSSQNPKFDERTQFLFSLIALMADSSLSLKDKISDVFLSVDMFRKHLSTRSADPYKERMIGFHFDRRILMCTGYGEI